MKRVLIVDDSLSVLQVLQFVFESEHYLVDTATDGAEGLVKISERLPDLVVTDSVMPGMDGFAFLQKLREAAETKSIPVIMLTSEDPQSPEHVAREPRPDAFLRKSADFSVLLNKVGEILNSR
jgi:DNA-binding response OmpR family regulator